MDRVEVAAAAAPAAAPAELAVEVAYAPAPRQVDHSRLRLAAGSCVADALAASGVLQRHGLSLEQAGQAFSLTLWGRACTPEQLLRDRDRVELCRPLQVDPKEARRQRYKGKAVRKGAADRSKP